MGIDLWQRKDQPTTPSNQAKPQGDYLTVSLNELAEQQLFQDIMLAFNTNLADVTQKDKAIVFNDIHWYFHDQATVSYSDGVLITPKVKQLSNSDIKKALWQLIHPINMEAQ